ncbi:unnamed protein product, partial [Laminaria digitata]
MDRKRRLQLTERWSKLEEDSDHEDSGGSDDGGGGGSSARGRSALVQLQFHNSWGRATPSKKPSKLVVKDPRSGDEDDDSDGLDGFIVSSEDDDD